jgi:hypothetical protein
VNLLVAHVFFLSNGTDRFENLFDKRFQSRIIALLLIVFIGIDFESLNHFDNLVLDVHLLDHSVFLLLLPLGLA